MMEYSVVMPCAGVGSRMQLGYNKLLLKMKNGKTVLENTMTIFLADDDCKQVVLVIGKQDQTTIEPLIHDHRVELVEGGKTRQESVYHGLQAVKYDNVLIHDGARPFLKTETLQRLLVCLVKHEACLLMVPAKDTIKVVENGVVINTPKRELMYQAQTPQAFKTAIVLEAFQQANKEHFIGTDDASVVEACGHSKIQVVMGDYDNIKITTPEDLNHPGF